MTDSRPLIVGLGELLWDLLPDGAHLGGAPGNFCYMAAMLGGAAAMVSRVGQDELGERAVQTLQQHGLDTTYVQADCLHPTGTVDVSLAANGLPTYTIHENVAWDYLAWTEHLAGLAARADAVCFGSLAQRSETSRSSILTFLEHTPPGCLRVFDVNLRQHYHSPQLIRESIARASVLKLNHEELPSVLEACGLPELPELEGARALRAHAGLKAVCVTRGPAGSIVDTADGTDSHPGVPVEIADTVGAGDAFTAAMTMHLLRGRQLPELSEFANRVAGLVASRRGAMPEFDAAERAFLAG